VVAEDKLAELGLEPMAWLHSWAAAGCEPSRMGIGPVPAVRRLFDRTSLSWSDIGVIELNEAFAPQVLAVLKGWGWSDGDSRNEILNVNGSGISLGHLIGSSHWVILSALRAVASWPTCCVKCTAAMLASAWKRCASAAARASQPFLRKHDNV
jgi:acetyl-CoA C-acetyltransferase